MCNFYLFLPLKELLNRNIKIYFLNNSRYRKWTNFYSFMDIVNLLFLQLGPFLTLGFFWEREARNILTNTPPTSGDILLLWNYYSIFICTHLLLRLQLLTWVWKSRGQFARKHITIVFLWLKSAQLPIWDAQREKFLTALLNMCAKSGL